MDSFAFINGAGFIGVNVHALGALVAGLRADDAASVSKLSRRCAWSAGGFALISTAGLALTLFNQVPRSDDVANRASRTAMAMAVGMNAAAFTLLGSALPLAAAAVLARRGKRLGPA